MEEHVDKIGLKKEDATDRTKWRCGIYELSRSLNQEVNPTTSVNGDKIRFKIVGLSLPRQLLMFNSTRPSTTQ